MVYRGFEPGGRRIVGTNKSTELLRTPSNVNIDLGMHTYVFFNVVTSVI